MKFLSAKDLEGFSAGRDARAFEKLGAHFDANGGVTRFAVWAPDAERIDLIGEHNGWAHGDTRLEPIDGTGVWQAIVRGDLRGKRYKYRIYSRHDGFISEKAIVRL